MHLQSRSRESLCPCVSVRVRADQVSPNDGRLEVFTRQGPYGVPRLLACVCCGFSNFLLPLLSLSAFKVIGMTLTKKVLKAPCGNVDIAFQPRRVEMRLKKGHVGMLQALQLAFSSASAESQRASSLAAGQHFQMDGEPWVLNAACTAVIERFPGCGPAQHVQCQREWT